MRKKELTIIIPTLNSSQYLKECLNSLKKQNYRNYQIFVADGGSKDNTLKIFNKYKFFYKIISKKDIACTDGVNKCIEKIKTKYFMILGSDDVIGRKNYIKNLINFLRETNSDIVLPQLGIIEKKIKKIIFQPNSFSCLKYKTIVPGFGWIAKTKIFYREKFNFKKYKIANDYEMFLRLYNKKYVFNRNNNSYYYFRLGGNSYKHYMLSLKEQRLIALKSDGPFLRIQYEYFKTVLKFKLKNIIKGFLN
jgi:glycosyltransferase involved in cell wall biosynthesis